MSEEKGQEYAKALHIQLGGTITWAISWLDMAMCITAPTEDRAKALTEVM